MLRQSQIRLCELMAFYAEIIIQSFYSNFIIHKTINRAPTTLRWSNANIYFSTHPKGNVHTQTHTYTLSKHLEKIWQVLNMTTGRYRSSCSLMFFEIGVRKNFADFTRKHLCWSLFFKKLQILRPVTLSKRYSDTGVFQ